MGKLLKNQCTVLKALVFKGGSFFRPAEGSRGKDHTQGRATVPLGRKGGSVIRWRAMLRHGRFFLDAISHKP
jgi:hypothetical protein